MANIENSNAPKKTKKPKKKGPIRWEAIVPFTIFVLIVWAYFFFFFDNHFKRALELAGTHANGAEVNVDRVKTSFWDASLEIHKIQVTNADEPIKNTIQIGQMRWKMLWDALLRGKIVIEDASILEVALGVPRARPGRVLPPPPPGSKSIAEKVREQALNEAKEQFSDNVLGDVAAILGGTDPAAQLKNIEGSLKSSLRINELQDELKKKEQEWKERIARLPQEKDLKALEARLKSVKVDGFNNPAEVQASLKELDSIFKEVDSKFKEVQSTGQALSTDTNTYQNALKELEAMVRQDIKDLEARLKIPSLDVESLSRSIFGPLFLSKVQKAESYMTKAREYMPPKKTPEEKAAHAPPKPREREVGRNYKFGIPNSYPLFWLKKAEISSKATDGADWSGDMSGTIRDVTDDPPILGRPTTAAFKGDFPKQEIMGVNGQLTIDHTTENPVEMLHLNVGGFPVLGQKLIESDDVTFGFDVAKGAATFVAELRGNEVKIESSTLFERKSGTGQVSEETGKPASFLLAEAKQPILADILKGAVADVPQVNLKASVSGPWSALRFKIDSNLGRDLAKAFEKQLQLKVNEAKAKVQALVDEKIGAEKAKLTAEFNKVKGQLDSVLKEKEAEINKAKNTIEQAKNEAVNSQKQKLENEGKKALEGLKKKLKF